MIDTKKVTIANAKKTGVVLLSVIFAAAVAAGFLKTEKGGTLIGSTAATGAGAFLHMTAKNPTLKNIGLGIAAVGSLNFIHDVKEKVSEMYAKNGKEAPAQIMNLIDKFVPQLAGTGSYAGLANALNMNTQLKVSDPDVINLQRGSGWDEVK